MKSIAFLAALLLISTAFLGCVEQPEESAAEPQFEEESFQSEEAAFDALGQELEDIEDLSPDELEQALQD